MTAKANNDDDRAQPSEALVQEHGDSYTRTTDNSKPFSIQGEIGLAVLQREILNGRTDTLEYLGVAANGNLYKYEYAKNDQLRVSDIATGEVVREGSQIELVRNEDPYRKVRSANSALNDSNNDNRIGQYLTDQLVNKDIYNSNHEAET